MRRLNVACGIVHKPSLIFFDEPTVAVDPQSRNNILEGIIKLNEKGATIIYISHYMEEVEFLCDRIVIIDKGHVIAQGTKEELKEMVSTYEKIIFTINNLSIEVLNKIKDSNHFISIDYQEQLLSIKYHKQEQNLLSILALFKEYNINYERITSEQPTLNDVFLKLTGKELRD